MNFFRRVLGSKGSINENSGGKICPTCNHNNLPEAKFCSACGNEFKIILDNYDAFISYRRETGSDLASLLKIQLESRFNKKVFLDVNELQVGRFDEELLHQIEKTANFILILSKDCLDRCVNRTDWLKQEIMHGIETNRNIIPVITDSFKFPSDELWSLLPSKMRILVTLNGINYSHIHQDSALRKIASYMKHQDEIYKSDPANDLEKVPPTITGNDKERSETTIEQKVDKGNEKSDTPSSFIKVQPSYPQNINLEQEPKPLDNTKILPELGPVELVNDLTLNENLLNKSSQPFIDEIVFVTDPVESLDSKQPHIGIIRFLTDLNIE